MTKRLLSFIGLIILAASAPALFLALAICLYALV